MNNEFKKYAIASMVLGIVSICLSFLGWLAFLGIVCGILAIVFSRKYSTSTAEKSGYATTGFVTGIIGGTLSLILAIVFIFTFIALKNTARSVGRSFESLIDTVNEEVQKIDTEEVTEKLGDALEEAKEKAQKVDTEEVKDKVEDALNSFKDKLQSMSE